MVLWNGAGESALLAPVVVSTKYSCDDISAAPSTSDFNEANTRDINTALSSGGVAPFRRGNNFRFTVTLLSTISGLFLRRGYRTGHHETATAARRRVDLDFRRLHQSRLAFGLDFKRSSSMTIDNSYIPSGTRKWLTGRFAFVGAIASSLLAIVAISMFCPSAHAAIATWDGSLDNYWGETYAPLADSNWSGGAGLFGRPASGDSLVFQLSQQPLNTALVDELATPGTFNIAGITFDPTCPAYTTDPSDFFPPFPHGFTLTGDITNSSTNLQTINDVIVATAVRTITLTAGGGDVTLGGSISGAGGGFTTAGTGKLTLSGTNSYTGALTVGATTTVDQTGAFNNGAGAAAGGNIVVGTAAANRAVLNISNNITAFDLRVGGATTGAGAVYQTAGAVSFTDTTAGAGAAAPDRIFSLGGDGSQGMAGYGYYRISNGSLGAKQFDVGARATSSVGVMEVTGGAVSATSKISIGRGNNLTSASYGLLNVSGGTVSFATGTATDPIEMGYSAGGVSVLDVGRVGGGPSATVNGASTTTGGVDLGNQNQTATGVVNLLSNGTLTTSRIFATSATPTALVNFNGGKLKATTATNAEINFLSDTNIDTVTVYNNGGTIDNSGTNITIGKALLAPAGSGVTSVPVATAGSGYIGAPMVRFTGGGGTGATGYAVMSGSGNAQIVSSIVITSPGTGYTAAPAVALFGGGATAAATLGVATTAANDSGGMTFTGSGVTTLTGTNTYTGATTISSGTLLINGDNSAATGAVTVEASGTLGGTGTVGSQVWSEGTINPGGSVGTLTVNGNVTMADDSRFHVELAGATADKLVINGDLDLSGLNNSLDVTGVGTGSSWQIASYTGTLTGTFENITSGYTVNYGTGANSVITLNFGVPGDYNGNGTVDAADYVLWRKGGPLLNEVDTPGTVNAADYTAWRARFGNAAGSGAGVGVNAAVPEPTTLVLLMFAAADWSLRRRRVA